MIAQSTCLPSPRRHSGHRLITVDANAEDERLSSGVFGEARVAVIIVVISPSLAQHLLQGGSSALRVLASAPALPARTPTNQSAAHRQQRSTTPNRAKHEQQREQHFDNATCPTPEPRSIQHIVRNIFFCERIRAISRHLLGSPCASGERHRATDIARI